MILKTLDIRNFQKHQNMHIQFSAGLNAIVAPSDSGKSSIRRALQFVLLNKPFPNMYHESNGTKAKEVQVTVKFEKNDVTHTITRKASKSKNTYVVDGTTYTAFGRGTPSFITDLINITDLNFQTQFQSPFLVGQSGGDAVKYINEQLDLMCMDKLSARINQDLREVQSKLSFLDQQKCNAVPDNVDVDTIISMCDQNLKKLQKCKIVTDCLTALDSATKVKDITFPDVNKVQDLQFRCQTVQDLLKDLEDLDYAYNKAGEMISQLEDVLSAIKVCPECGRAL